MSTTLVPPQPNASEYPLSALYIYPTVTTGPFDSTKPLKNWSRAIGQGENPNDFIVFGGYPTPAAGQTPVYDPNALGMTIADAAEVNIQPASVPSADANSVAMTSPAVLSPARPLAPGETIVPMIGGWNVVNANFVAAPQPETPQSTDSANLQTILGIVQATNSTVNAIAEKLGVTPTAV